MKLLSSTFIVVILISTILYAQDPPAPPRDEDDDALDYIYIHMGVFSSFYCAVITTYNASRLHSDHPTRIGGAAGALFGIIQTTAGVAILFGDDDIAGWGAGFAAVGLVTTYYGVKNILGVRQKYFEEQEGYLTIEPSIRRDSKDSSAYGVMFEYRF